MKKFNNNENKLKSALIWLLIFGMPLLMEMSTHKPLPIWIKGICWWGLCGVIMYYLLQLVLLNKRSLPKKYDIADLKHANAISHLLKTDKNAYKYSQDRDALIAFMVYTYFGGNEVAITDDMARLFEKQLRWKDLYLDHGLNADKTAMLPEDERANLTKKLNEEAKIYTWIPLIDIKESLKESSACLDMTKPSIRLERVKFELDLDINNVIACPINEFYTGGEFSTDQILIIEQDRYVNEVVKYSDAGTELVIQGKLLFAVTNPNLLLEAVVEVSQNVDN